jgi:hypothetical protein
MRGRPWLARWIAPTSASSGISVGP